MSTALIILKQLITMFIYMGVGMFMYKKDLVTKESSKALANLLIFVVLPCVIFKSFCTERTPQKQADFLVSVVRAFFILMFSVVISHIIFKKDAVEDVGVAFSNAGFIGLPIVTAVLGSDAVFYRAGFVALLNIIQATYGQYLLSGGDKNMVSFKTVRKNPVVISVVFGIVVFYTGIQIPSLIFTSINSISAMNGPLAMIIIGVYMAQADMKSMFTSPRVYFVSLVRLRLIPALTLVLVKLTMGAYHDIAYVLMIVSSASIGSNVAVYAQKLGGDYTYAVKIVCMSTILSILTMPVIMLLL